MLCLQIALNKGFVIPAVQKRTYFLISQFSQRQKEEIWSPKTIIIVYNVIRNYIPDCFCSVHK